jgi:hypothetical protein
MGVSNVVFGAVPAMYIHMNIRAHTACIGQQGQLHIEGKNDRQVTFRDEWVAGLRYRRREAA